MRRAVITGIGPVTPVGIGKEAFWAGIRSGQSSVQRVSAFDPSRYPSQIAAEIRDFDPADYLGSPQARKLNRYAQYCVAAARLAVQDAGLDLASEDLSRVGVAIGSALGGIGFAEAQYGVFREKRIRAVDPSFATTVFRGSGSCEIAMDIGATGPVIANSNSCASGVIALGEALGCIRHGETNTMLAGGAEAPLFPLCFGAFARNGAMSRRNDEPERACRPFDAERDGFVMGEGAAVLVIEEFHHALNRGARIYCELVGCGVTNDACHMIEPLPDGGQAARAMRLALDNAGVKPDEIDYISAHGSSIPLNDKTETLAIKSVFGDHARKVLISSTKGHHGHALGATGAMEVAASALAMERAFVPPTLNLENPDADCDLDYVPNQGRAREIHAVLSNSFGFGGINACLVLRKVRL